MVTSHCLAAVAQEAKGSGTAVGTMDGQNRGAALQLTGSRAGRPIPRQARAPRGFRGLGKTSRHSCDPIKAIGIARDLAIGGLCRTLRKGRARIVSPAQVAVGCLLRRRMQGPRIS